MLYRSRLVHREKVARETLAIRVERPSGFTFEAGQYVDITVLNPPRRDLMGPTRSMSVASATQASPLEFLMRLRDSAFKQALATQPIGAELLLEGPLDDLALLAEPARELVFIAGGVGIATFLSALRDAAAAARTLRCTLFYANRCPEDAAYLEELRRMEGAIPGFKLVATMTRARESASGWTGETEHPGIGLLSRHLPSLVGPKYFIAGSPSLISALRAALRGAGVPATDIGIELYGGY